MPVAMALNENQLISQLTNQYELSLQENSQRKVSINKQSGRIEQDIYRLSLSKPIIDEIDALIAKRIGLSNAELDYIVNFEIKYRLGLSGGDTDD